MVKQAPVICVMAPPIHLGAWSMALMLCLPFELLATNLAVWALDTGNESMYLASFVRFGNLGVVHADTHIGSHL